MWKIKVLIRYLVWWEKWVKVCIVKDRLYIKKEIYLCICICRLKNKKKIILYYINKKVYKIY